MRPFDARDFLKTDELRFQLSRGSAIVPPMPRTQRTDQSACDSTRTMFVAALLCTATPLFAQDEPPRIERFAAARFERGHKGGDGLVRAVVVVDRPWAYAEAEALAQALGGRLASIDSTALLSFVGALANLEGAFECDGPWIGGSRSTNGAWAWTSGASFDGFAWAPGRPAQTARAAAALVLGGAEKGHFVGRDACLVRKNCFEPSLTLLRSLRRRGERSRRNQGTRILWMRGPCQMLKKETRWSFGATTRDRWLWSRTACFRVNRRVQRRLSLKKTTGLSGGSNPREVHLESERERTGNFRRPPLLNNMGYD